MLQNLLSVCCLSATAVAEVCPDMQEKFLSCQSLSEQD